MAAVPTPDCSNKRTFMAMCPKGSKLCWLRVAKPRAEAVGKGREQG